MPHNCLFGHSNQSIFRTCITPYRCSGEFAGGKSQRKIEHKKFILANIPSYYTPYWELKNGYLFYIKIFHYIILNKHFYEGEYKNISIYIRNTNSYRSS